MLRATTFIVAAFALNAQSALAGPIGGSANASQNVESAGKSSDSGFVSTVISQIKFSISVFGGKVGHSSDDSGDYKSSPQQQCRESTDAVEEDQELGEAKKTEPVGPEPLYFGF